jgi:hypothetical protein
MLSRKESLRKSSIQKIGGIKMFKLPATAFLLIFFATGSIGGCGGGDGGGGDGGGGSGGESFVCERDRDPFAICFCSNLSGGMSQTCEYFLGTPEILGCEEISNSPCPNTFIFSGSIELGFTSAGDPNRELCFVLQTDDGQRIRLVDGPDVKVEDVLFPGASVTVQATLGPSGGCTIPIDNEGEVLDIIEISGPPVSPPELPPTDLVSAPELISPINNAIIEQNNPDTGCPFDPDRGYGYRIFYDWTDSTSPNGIKEYFLRIEKRRNGFTSETRKFTTSSEYTDIQCNDFRDEGLSWRWDVRAIDNLDFLSGISELGEFQFGPCLLEDGSPCFVTPPELLSPEDGVVIEQNNPNTGCPYDPDRGYGYKITFDWTETEPETPGATNVYVLNYFIRTVGGDPLPRSSVTTETEITWLKCNQFVPDDRLDGWEWYVRASDGRGNLSPITEIRTYSFVPCRLDDGTPCHYPP